jgi:formylglycine-generating enzyme required for sulfatase activity
MNEVRARWERPGSTDRERFRAGLALLGADPSVERFLFRMMLGAGPDELMLIRGALAPGGARFADELRRTVEDEAAEPGARFRAAAALAAFAPEHPCLVAEGERVVSTLLAVNPLELGSWAEAFRPARAALLDPLRDEFGGDDPNRSRVAATVLADYASDRPDLVLDLLLIADPRQYATLFPKVRDHLNLVTGALTRELAKSPPPGASHARRDEWAGRRANAVATLARVGETGPLGPALRHAADPRVRSYLLHRLGPLGVDPRTLIERLEPEPEASVRSAVVLALDAYPPEVLTGDERRALAARLLDAYGRDPDPGFHAAVGWLLDRWGYAADLDRLDRSLAGAPAGARGWYVAPGGQTFVVIRDPADFTMGSPEDEQELGRNPVERQHRRRIPRSFALAAREVTVAEFREFLRAQDPPSVAYDDADQREFSRDGGGPALSMTWFQAAQYCRWRSEREGVAWGQMCYPHVAEIREGMRLPPDYLARTGYRLPTEAEWEYACRAGTVTPYEFGSDLGLLPQYAWHLRNSARKGHETAWRTGLLKPNGFGLFDMHGNVYEWCHDRVEPYPDAEAGAAVVDREQAGGEVRGSDRRRFRGGSFSDHPPMLRSAYRDGDHPANHAASVGFRVARTYPTR